MFVARILALVLMSTVALVGAGGCRASDGPTESAKSVPASPSPIEKNTHKSPDTTGARTNIVLAGKIVDLASAKVVHDLDRRAFSHEWTLAERDLGLLFWQASGTIEAFELSTGQRRWRLALDVPCHDPELSSTAIFAICGSDLLAVRLEDGTKEILESHPAIWDIEVARELLVLHAGQGVISTYDVRDAPRKVAHGQVDVFALARTETGQISVSSWGQAGFCVAARVLDRSSVPSAQIRVGCYSPKLRQKWLQAIPARAEPGGPELELRFWGDQHVVFDRQAGTGGRGGPSASSLTMRGVVFELEDGAMRDFADGVIAVVSASGTVEHVPGAGLSSLLIERRRTEHEPGPRGFVSARVVRGSNHIYALIDTSPPRLKVAARAGKEWAFEQVLAISPEDIELSVELDHPVVRVRGRDGTIESALVRDRDTGAAWVGSSLD